MRPLLAELKILLHFDLTQCSCQAYRGLRDSVVSETYAPWKGLLLKYLFFTTDEMLPLQPTLGAR